jgi:hypothetical protein
LLNAWAFRTDVETFISRDVIDASVVDGRHELPRVEGVRYVAFVDPSGGSADAMTLAIAHAESGRGVLDVVRERRPPFSPDAVVADFATQARVRRDGATASAGLLRASACLATPRP